MLRKKNYKEQEHFTQLHSFSIIGPATAVHGPRKYQIYYKRYRKQKQSENLYNLIHGLGGQGLQQAPSQIQVQPKYSEDRTLQLISFDGDLTFLKKYLRKIGKIRQYDCGEALYKGHRIFTAMCVFKFEFDLVKCFRDDFLQIKIDEQCVANSKEMTEEDREDQRYNMIQQHMGNQLSQKVGRLKQMQEDGFQVVTDIYGQYRMDYDANKKFVEDLPQIKRKKKRQEKQRRLQEELEREAQNK